MTQSLDTRGLGLYLTAPYPCSYLPNRAARSQVATLDAHASVTLYEELARVGFRRSGEFIYRPRCDGCRACLPLRINVEAFQPDRSQRRAWKRHAHLLARELEPRYDPQHLMLYARYIHTRHPDTWLEQQEADLFTDDEVDNAASRHGVTWPSQSRADASVAESDLAQTGQSSLPGLTELPDAAQVQAAANSSQSSPMPMPMLPEVQPSAEFESRYREFLLRSCVTTRLIEFHEPTDAREAPGALRMVSVVDVLGQALSAVYTFFDPSNRADSLGTYAILWQIERARRLGLAHVYLGYWVEGSRTMQYKRRFHASEIWQGGKWISLEKLEG